MSRTLTVADMLAVRAPVDVALSPDDALLAVVARTRSELVHPPGGRLPDGTSSMLAGLHVYVGDADGGKVLPALADADRSWGPAWRPDGDVLAFVADRDGSTGLWCWERATGTARLVSAGLPGRLAEPSTWVGGNRLLVTCRVADEVPADATADATADTTADGVTLDHYYSPPRSPGDEQGVWVGRKHSDTHRDVLLLDPATGELTTILADIPAESVYPSPDGRWLAVHANTRRPRMESFRLLRELHVYDLTTAERSFTVEDLDTPAFGAGAPAWSPDGTRLATVRDGTVLVQELSGELRQLDVPAALQNDANKYEWALLWDPAGGRLIAHDADNQLWLVDPTGDARVLPLPDATGVPRVLKDAGGGTFWSPDGQHVYVSSREAVTLRRQLWALPMDGTAPRLLAEQVPGIPLPDTLSAKPSMSVTSDGTRLFVVGESESSPPEVWCLDASGAAEQVTTFNDHLDDVDLSAGQIVSWPNSKGERTVGLLLLPVGRRDGETVPLIVDAYPGGERWVHMWDTWEGFNIVFKQLLNARGYGVFMPQGDAANRFESRAQLADPILTGLDELTRLGIADDRVALVGQSGGGYLTNCAITVTDRFRAAVSYVGPSNLASHFGQLWPFPDGPLMHGVTNSEGMCRGAPWQVPDQYVELSPVFFLDRVQTPLLLVYGKGDSGVFVQQGDEMFVGLSRLGKEVEILRYTGEGHGPQYYTPPNRDDVLSRVLAFLDRHLLPKPAH